MRFGRRHMQKVRFPLPDLAVTRRATRLAFFTSGFGFACWAPLVPFARARLHADDATMGFLLLCLGVGSISAMLVTGPLSGKYGSRPLVLASATGLAIALPFLSTAASDLSLAFALLLFGGSLGSLDVAMNLHASEVEKLSAQNLMSGFHALYSIGGFAGAGLMTCLLSVSLPPLDCALICSLMVLIGTLLVRNGLLPPVPRDQAGMASEPVFVLPHGLVLVMAVQAAIMFLVEGAVLDWGALLITQRELVSVSRGGLGYILFSIAMTAGRLCGDAISERFGNFSVLLSGSSLSLLGFAALLLSPNAALAMSGFVLIGLGASNVVPVIFRAAGAQRLMPPGMAIAAVTTLGYAGVLVGPALIGFVAKGVGLPAAFWLLAALLTLVPLSAWRISRVTS